MKHYFIYRKGNDSEKLAKSQREQRKIIKHYHCQEECNEVKEADPGGQTSRWHLPQARISRF